MNEQEGLTKLRAFVAKIAEAKLWDEFDEGKVVGMDPDGSVTREFQEDRENEAQDWVIEARELTEASIGATER